MTDSPEPDISFEQAMRRLDEIVAQMEGDRLPLEDMVGTYEEGMRLLKICRQRVDHARRRIEVIASNAEGKPTVAAFEPPAAEAPVSEEKSRPASPARRKKPVETEEDPDDIRLF